MANKSKKAIVIGGSAGAVVLLYDMLKKLSPNFPYPLIIVLHRPDDKVSEMRNIFQAQCQLPVVEPHQKTFIEDSTVYLAPPGYHMVVEEDYSLTLDSSPLVQFSRPSVDVLFMTAADVYKENLTGIIVTGTNQDGSQGMDLIHQLGGVTIAQDPDDAKLSRMPEAAIECTKIDHILSAKDILKYLNNL